MGRLRQAGASGLMIAVILVLLVVVLLATRVLSRLGDAADDRSTTMASLARAQTALDQFVASAGASGRLPCPADPALDTGLEDPTPATGNCNSATGTIPWRTIGLRRDDGYDAWGRKLSYRVYSGNAGNLTLQGGPSMVDCYLDPANPTESGAGTVGGKCASSHTSSAYDFLGDGKGLKVTDMGTDHFPSNHDPAAYVVISHGPTGYGGYTVSGDQLQSPPGDEKDNTKASGPFHVEAWSAPDTAATNNQHFDDIVVYRTVADLARNAGLKARAWPATPTASASFNNAALDTIALGLSRLLTGNTNSVNFGTITASGLAGGSAADIVLDTSGSTPGLGVGGGADNQVSSSRGDSMKFALNDSRASASKIGITLSSFGTYVGTVPAVGSFTYTEQVQFKFYNNGSLLSTTVTKSACTTGQAVASYTITPVPSTSFDAVEVVPLAATSTPTGSTGDTSFSISAIAFCGVGGSCPSGVASATTCP